MALIRLRRLTCTAGVDERRIRLIVGPPEALWSAHVEIGNRLAELKTPAKRANTTTVRGGGRINYQTKHHVMLLSRGVLKGCDCSETLRGATRDKIPLIEFHW